MGINYARLLLDAADRHREQQEAAGRRPMSYLDARNRARLLQWREAACGHLTKQSTFCRLLASEDGGVGTGRLGRVRLWTKKFLTR